MSETAVHNHAPWRPMCNERVLSSGQRRGACLTDDGTPADRVPGTAEGGGGRG